MALRRALFAGNWYPGTASECEKKIRSFLETEEPSASFESPCIGGIVPHAGWNFSGRIACNVIHRMSAGGAKPDAFVVFGMHLHPGSNRYMMTSGAWETPFGAMEVDSEFAGELGRRFHFTIETAANFTPDNTIELQLPFIKFFFPESLLIPVGVPPSMESLRVGEAVSEISGNMSRRVAVLGSTDLTHYGAAYGFNPKGSGRQAADWVRSENDRKIIEAMISMEPERVLDQAAANKNACCAGAAAAAISAARKLGAKKAETVAYATSYDQSPGDSLVGYAGIVFM
ncbi:MAG: AmmeMemoRadiSam system protein B [Desulfobacteraceae bacterium]|nr:MAG: AmmeMemoRadiSam system protein B [Desulfobacteraceae bacterium]